MDADRLGRDAATSLRLPLTSERRLIGGTVLALAAYAAWVAATGAVFVSAAAVSGRSLAVVPWTTTTTLAAAVATVLWVFGPAAAWTYFVVDQLTNGAGNLEHHYRVQYPSTVIVPPLILFAAVGAAGAVLGEATALVLAALVASGTFVLVRTLAYSYRVFTLSIPRAVQAFVFESGCVLAIAVLAALARVSGRQGLLLEAARGADGVLGAAVAVPLVTGSREIATVTLPALPALAAGFPVALALVYVAVQTLGGLVARVRGVTVPRSRLRTGQRYPAFARPVAGRSGRRGSPADAPSADDLDGAAAELLDGEDGSAAADRVTETRVFTPPDDADLEAAVPAEVAAETETQIAEPADDTAGSDSSGGSEDGGEEAAYECPACGEVFSGETAFAYCPTCGTELEPG